MRYKAIPFYMPLEQSMIGSRIHHFTLNGGTNIISEHPGSVYDDGNSDYFELKDIPGFYRRHIPGGAYTNIFNRIMSESDLFFNFDLMYNLLDMRGDEDDLPMDSDTADAIQSKIVVQFVKPILRLER